MSWFACFLCSYSFVSSSMSRDGCTEMFVSCGRVMFLSLFHRKTSVAKVCISSSKNTTGRQCMCNAASLKALKALCGRVLSRYYTPRKLFCRTPQRETRAHLRKRPERERQTGADWNLVTSLTLSRVHPSPLPPLSSSQLWVCDFQRCPLGVCFGFSFLFSRYLPSFILWLLLPSSFIPSSPCLAPLPPSHSLSPLIANTFIPLRLPAH